jgi:predicted amidohydrolase
MRTARLAAAQMSSCPGDTEHNLAEIARITGEAAKHRVDLVCFPELAVPGFVSTGMEALAEPVPGPTSVRLGELARSHQTWLVAGMAVEHPEGKRPYNSALAIDPAGEVAAVYHKVYLFPGELGVFTPASEPCLVELPFARAAISICYDYIFPDYVSALVDQGAELILHLTAWLMTPLKKELRYNPQGYRAVGMTRAVENTVWLLSANQYGPYDESGEMQAVGQSSIIAPWAEVLAEVGEGEGIAVAEIDFDSAEKWRSTVAPYLRDRRTRESWQT